MSLALLWLAAKPGTVEAVARRFCFLNHYTIGKRQARHGYSPGEEGIVAVAEIFSESHRALQIFCADYWDKAEDCEAILSQVIVGPNRINMAEPALARWLSIIKELLRKDDGSMQRLVVALMAEYPQNDALRTVCEPWIPAAGAHGVEPPVAVNNDKKKPKTIAKDELPEGTVLVEEFKETPEETPKAIVKATPKPAAIGVIAAADFADEADMVIPRVNTLWDVMVDQERRIVELERLLAQLAASVGRAA